MFSYQKVLRSCSGGTVEILKFCAALKQWLSPIQANIFHLFDKIFQAVKNTNLGPLPRGFCHATDAVNFPPGKTKPTEQGLKIGTTHQKIVSLEFLHKL